MYKLKVIKSSSEIEYLNMYQFKVSDNNGNIIYSNSIEDQNQGDTVAIKQIKGILLNHGYKF